MNGNSKTLIIDCARPDMGQIQHELEIGCERAHDANTTTLLIGIQSRETLPRDPARHLLLEFNHLFDANDAPYPHTWQQIYAVLRTLRSTIAATLGKPKLVFEPYAHLTIAYQLGNLFDEPSGFKPNILQKGELWDPETPADESFALDIQHVPGLVGTRDITLEMYVTLDVTKQVNAYLLQLERPIRQRIQIRARDAEIGEYWLNSAQAVRFARRVRRALGQAYGDVNYERVHVFGTIPFGLAVWIGRWVNGVGPLQLYEWNNATHVYLPSWEIS